MGYIGLAKTGSKKQVTELFSNEVLARLCRMRINASRRFTNRSRGENLSGKGGQSIDFADYRNYVAGDDIRYVDWNIFARLRRPYLKQFRVEEELHVTILIDGSTSMGYEDKLLRAKQLAGAFAVMGLFGGEKVSVFVANELGGRLKQMRPCRGRVSMQKVFAFLESIEGGGEYPIDLAVEQMLRQHRGRGVALLLSDFFTFGDLTRTFNMLHSAGLEAFAIQLLGPNELDPELSGDLRLIDSETHGTLDVSSVGQLMEVYQDHLRAFSDQIATLTRQRNGRSVLLPTSDDVKVMLFDTLLRKGWLA